MILVDMPTQSAKHSHSDQHFVSAEKPKIRQQCLDETVNHIKNIYLCC